MDNRLERDDTYISIEPLSQDLGSIREALNNYISRREHTMIIVARCSVVYRGRASSETGPGTRVVVIKPDGTLLVHEAEGRDPLNWQPPGSLCRFTIEENRLKLVCKRPRHGEEVVVVLEKIYHIGLARLSISRDFEVRGVERDIVERIVSSGLPIDREAGLVGREVSTPHGKIDLVYINNNRGVLYIVEVKNERAGVVAVDQLKRYVDYMRGVSGVREVVGVLVAGGITSDAMRTLLSYGFYYIDARSLSPVSVTRRLDEYTRDPQQGGE